MPTVPYVKQSWADGSGGGTPKSAARLLVIENGIYDVSLAPCVHVTHNANQSISDNTLTTLAFNTERYDQASGASAAHHDTVTDNSRLKAVYAGVYSIKVNVEWAGNSTGLRYVLIRLNGTTVIGQVGMAATTASAIQQNLSVDYALAVNDYVEVRVLQNSGGALNLSAVSNNSPEFSMHRVG